MHQASQITSSGFCWLRGYIVVTHGGGASMILQTNDVLLHKEVRKQFIELQTAFLLGKTRNIGGGLVDCTHEESLDLMIQVMSDRNLHLNGAKAYKHTGTTLAFDGTEDGELRNDARGFWHRLGMRKKIDAAVKEVEDAWHFWHINVELQNGAVAYHTVPR